jgi:ribosomal protein L11 methylase PrmA
MATSNRVPGSFRDPSGYLFWHDDSLYRYVATSYREDYDAMASSGFYEAAVAAGHLIPHEEVENVPGTEDAYRVLRPEVVGFISYPYEWCFSQLKDAALLTLALQNQALSFGLSLKDASAYNVQFRGSAPVFIDSLSFERYSEGQPWVAYQQFCRHFLAPLALMAYRHVGFHKLLRVNIDGVPLDLASASLPLRSRLNPSLLIHVHLHARLQRRHGDRAESAERAKAGGMSKTGMLGLIDGLESAVRRLQWKPARTEWGDYYDATNYTAEAHDAKASLVKEFIDAVGPRTVWDLGANTGKFSRIASDAGIATVAFDIDAAAVEKNYLHARSIDESSILPLLMDLTNPSPGLGWDGSERSSLTERGPADVALALALIHHLAIGNNVPLERTATFFARLGRQLVIEFVPKSDSQVVRLLRTREDIFPDYHEAGFEAAFSKHFEILKRSGIAGSERTLYLMARR